MVGKIAIVIFVLLFSAFAIFELYVFFIHEPEEVITEVAFYENENYTIKIEFYDDNSLCVTHVGKYNYDYSRCHAHYIDENTVEYNTQKGGFKIMHQFIFYDDYLEVVYIGSNDPFNKSDLGRYELLSSMSFD